MEKAMKQDSKETMSKDKTSQQQQKRHQQTLQRSTTCHRVLAGLLLVLMAIVGVTSIIIGFMNVYDCGNAVILPVLLAVNGLLWLLPPLVVTAVNCISRHHGDDLNCIQGCLEKAFFVCVAFLVGSTIYVLVTVTQARTMESLCTRGWLPPYVLCMLIANWVCFVVFFCLFCCSQNDGESSKDQGGPGSRFKHLNNLPPLTFPWNRHRAIRTH